MQPGRKITPQICKWVKKIKKISKKSRCVCDMVRLYINAKKKGDERERGEKRGNESRGEKGRGKKMRL